MEENSMNSKQVECFLVVSECLNYTEAGKRLFISQSNVSRQIITLEEELGFELFVRGNNFVQLTPAGSIMVPAFRQMIDIFQEQKKLASHVSLGESGELRIGFLTNMNLDKICKLQIEEFKNRYPNIILSYLCFPAGDFEEALRNSHVDVLFTHDFDTPTSSNNLTKKICSTNMFLVFGESHPLAKKENLNIKDFKNDVFWITDSSDTEKRKDLIKNLCNYYGLNDLKTKKVSNFDTVLVNIKLGNGVAFLDELSLSQIPHELRTLELAPEISEVGININWNKKNLNTIIPLFINLIKAPDRI